VSMWSFLRAAQTGKRGWWAAVAAANLLAVYTHYFAVFLPATELLWALWLTRTDKSVLKRFMAWQAVAAVLYAPWLPTLFRRHLPPTVQFTRPWIPPLSWRTLPFLFRHLASGYGAGVWTGWAATALLAGVFVVGSVNWIREARPGRLLAAGFWVPVAGLATISVLHPLFLSRYILYVSALFALVVGRGFAVMNRKWAPAGAGAFLILTGMALGNLYADVIPTPEVPYHVGVHEHKQYRASTEHIRRHAAAGDGVAHVCLNTIAPFRFYAPELEGTFIYLGAPPIDPELWRERREHFGTVTVPVEEFVKGKKRVWLVFSSWEEEQLVDLQPVKDWFDSRFNCINTAKFKGVTLYLYEPAPR